jgi:hypothetical protein
MSVIRDVPVTIGPDWLIIDADVELTMDDDGCAVLQLRFDRQVTDYAIRSLQSISFPFKIQIAERY